eukprot:scaffold71641_cov48-Phaeocystis_antarctica.AAC.1
MGQHQQLVAEQVCVSDQQPADAISYSSLAFGGSTATHVGRTGLTPRTSRQGASDTAGGAYGRGPTSCQATGAKCGGGAGGARPTLATALPPHPNSTLTLTLTL